MRNGDYIREMTYLEIVDQLLCSEDLNQAYISLLTKAVEETDCEKSWCEFQTTLWSAIAAMRRAEKWDSEEAS